MMLETKVGLKVKSVMIRVFNLNESDILETSSQDTISNWDSLRHMVLIEALEDEFSIELKPEQIFKMRDVKAVVATIEQEYRN
ncbi:MAG: acyl carrier protein [Elusimicrobiota bacterium]